MGMNKLLLLCDLTPESQGQGWGAFCASARPFRGEYMLFAHRIFFPRRCRVGGSDASFTVAACRARLGRRPRAAGGKASGGAGRARRPCCTGEVHCRDDAVISWPNGSENHAWEETTKVIQTTQITFVFVTSALVSRQSNGQDGAVHVSSGGASRGVVSRGLRHVVPRCLPRSQSGARTRRSHRRSQTDREWRRFSIWSQGSCGQKQKLNGSIGLPALPTPVCTVLHTCHTFQVCSVCRHHGATLGCFSKGCGVKYHYMCAVEKGERNWDLILFFRVCVPRHFAVAHQSGCCTARICLK